MRRALPSGRGSRLFETLEGRLLLAADSCHDDEDDVAEEAGDTADVSADTFYALDAGSTLSTAYDLGQLGATRSYNGRVGGLDTRDVMRFTLAGQSQVTLGLSGLAADIDLALYDASGQRLALSNRGGSAAESISVTLAAGAYYIDVVPWRRAVSNYVLTVGATATPPVENPPTTPPSNPPEDPTTPVTSFPDVAYFGGGNDWNLNSINAPESWANGYKGQGVVVAVVDTGVDWDHPDLASQIWVNTGENAGNGIDDDRNGFVDDVRGWDFSSGDNNPDDGNGHGTHVAGTIAADDNGFGATGVAPDATIMPIRVLANNGSGTAAAVAAGIRYAAQMGADIINLSLGGALSSVIQSAIQYALSLDVLVVAAAGNESAATPGYPARFSASLSNVLSVGAYASSGSIASFSNDVGSSGAVQVDAPGVSVYSTYAGGGYRSLSGTSMAAPHVAGLAALALSANDDLTAAQLRNLIVQGANRAIGGSDSNGGINAAVTVALAAGGQASTSSASAAAQSQASTQIVAIRRFLARSSEAFDALLPAATTDAENSIAGETVASSQPASAQTTDAPQSAREVALLAMQAADEDACDLDGLAEGADDDLVIDVLGRLGRGAGSHASAYHIVV